MKTDYVVATALLLLPWTLPAQNCNNPAFPASNTTTTQDRDQMLCQLGIQLPVLPTRLSDPNGECVPARRDQSGRELDRSARPYRGTNRFRPMAHV